MRDPEQWVRSVKAKSAARHAAKKKLEEAKDTVVAMQVYEGLDARHAWWCEQMGSQQPSASHVAAQLRRRLTQELRQQGLLESEVEEILDAVSEASAVDPRPEMHVGSATVASATVFGLVFSSIPGVA